MTSTLCPGTCNAKYRRAHAIYESEIAEHAVKVERLTEAGMADRIPAPPVTLAIDPVYGEPTWCSRCKAIINRDLAELDELGSRLAMLPPGIRPAIDRPRERVKITGSHTAPSPSPTGDDVVDLVAWLRYWEDEYRTLHQWGTPPPRGFLSSHLTATVGWLGSKLEGILLTALAEDFGHGVIDWHRSLVNATHSARSARHVKKRCPRCDLFTLWEEIGEDYIRCVNEDCNRRMTREELHNATAETTPAATRRSR